MDINTILAQVDMFYGKQRGEEAEKLLQNSIRQAGLEQDRACMLQLLNELLGYYRETGRKEDAARTAAQAVAMAKLMGLQGTIPYANTILNVANAYRACGMLQESAECYREVQDIYDALLEPGSILMAGLKNNVSLLCQETGDFAGAKEKQLEALAIVQRHGAAYEEGVTCANLGNTCMQLGEAGEAYRYALLAMEIFSREKVGDSHYAAAIATLGAYHYREKDYRRALEYYRQAMGIVEKNLGRNEGFARLQEHVTACETAIWERMSKGAAPWAAEARFPSERPAERQPSETAQSRCCQPQPAETAAPAGGLELSRAYYGIYGRPMIEQQFSEYADRIAVGLAGRGSDCFGYDDAASRDHDWGPDFCMWLTDETYAEIGERLQQAYGRLPDYFQGYRRAPRVSRRRRRGVMRISEFYRELVGAADYAQIDWRTVSDASLAAAVNGEVFRDEEGIFTAFRERLKTGYPEEIRYLKLAESGARYAQAAQYNYPRVLGRGDVLTAQMLAWDGIREAMRIQHYIEGRYLPHDKWLARSLQESEEGREVAAKLLDIAGALRQPGGWAPSETARIADSVPSASAQADSVPPESAQSGSMPSAAATDAPDAVRLIEELGAYFAMELYARNFISDTESYLDAHSEELLYKASLAGKTAEALAEEIAELEFEAFDKVRNEGGRASCQNDWPTFSIMRRSQYLTWDRTMLTQYLYDFHREYDRGHNLIEEKYGRMMESTAPGQYEKIRGRFPELTQEKKDIIEQIVRLQVGWMEEFAARYPALAHNARNIHTAQDNFFDTSYETYLRGELGTYSDKMLELYGRYVVRYAGSGGNVAQHIMENSAKLYGYASLEDAERRAETENSGRG